MFDILSVWIDLPSFTELVSHVENSPLMKESLQTLQIQDGLCVNSLREGVKPKSLVQHVPHRWFSVFSMLERMVELKPFLCRLCQQTSHDNWFPTEGDWDAAVWLLDTLRPLKTVSDNLEKCHDVTISLVRHQLLPAKVIPSVRVIADDLETKLSAGLGMRPDEKRALRCLIKVNASQLFWQKLQSCFGPTAPELTTMLIASFLDPRTKGDTLFSNVQVWINTQTRKRKWSRTR